MRLPWDRNYFKICFYVVAAFIMCYISKKIIDLAGYTLVNMGDLFLNFSGMLGKLISVFSVILIGFAAAYILDPIAEYFQNKYCKIFKKQQTKNRMAGTSITYVIIIAIIAVIGYTAFNKINSFGNKGFVGNLSYGVQGYVADLSLMYEKLISFVDKYDLSGAISDIIRDFAQAIIDFTQNLGSGTVTAISSIGSGFANFFVSMVVAFYFLKDKEDIKKWLDKLAQLVFKEKTKCKIYSLLEKFHNIFSGYIRGQLTDAFIMCVLITSGLSIINVRFSLVIGIISGFSNIIPYFGAIIGFCLAVAMALIEGNITKAVYAAIIMLVLQQIDSIIIVPKVVGENVKLSPVLVIISLAVAGNLFGIVGMIFAVPVTAVIKMCIDRYVK